jgi:ParB-like chromosome segregation protein Spo0J
MADEPMADLVESIRELGIIEPLIVRPLYQWGDGSYHHTAEPECSKHLAQPMRYEIVDGHRRAVAAETVGLELVPVMVHEGEDVDAHAIMLHTNVCREDVTPFEEGVQFLELATKHQWGIERMMRVFHKSEAYINDRVDIVQKDQHVAAAVRARQINLAQAKQILRSPDPVHRLYLVDQAAVHGATARTLHVMVDNHQNELRAAQGELKAHTPDFAPEPVPIAAPACCWCGESDDQANMRQVPCHWYHQRDLERVLDQVAVRNIPKSGGAGEAPVPVRDGGR